MPLPPISYGPPVQADLQGVETASRALGQREKMFEAVRGLGGEAETGGQNFAQMQLHVEASKATAASVERTSQAMANVENMPYARKSDLQRLFGADFNEVWAKMPSDVKDAEAKGKPIPSYLWGRDYFTAETRKARDDAAQLIGLKGWQEEWKRTAFHADNEKMEMLDRRILAPQHVDYLTGEQLQAADSVADNAQTPKDFDNAVSMIEHSMIVHGNVRRTKVEQYRKMQDQFTAQQAITREDVPTMKSELAKLEGDGASEKYPNITQQQRLQLAQTLKHHINTASVQADTDEGLTWARGVAASSQLGGSSVVDRTAAQKSLAALQGSPAKIKAAESELNRLMAEGDKAQETVEGRAFTRGVDEIEHGGHISKEVRTVLTNPNGTKAAGSFYERLAQLERATDKRDPIRQMEEARGWGQARDVLQRTRVTGMAFEEFLARDTADGGLIGERVPTSQLKSLANLFIAKQKSEKRSDEHPLTPEQGKEIRLIMRSAYGVDPEKALTPDELTLHANIEKYVLDKRNAVQDAGGTVKDTDYATWINEQVRKPDEMHLFLPWTWDKPWTVKTPAETASKKEPEVIQWETGPDGKPRRKVR